MAVTPDTSESGGSRVFVRNSTGLVREASALDATIFNAVFSAPVGATLAIGVLWTLSAFPGADPVWATIIAVVINVPVLIMMALLASSMPRTGGDYVWVSRILSPPLAMISNFAAALSAMIGATFWARFFPVFALGPVLVGLGVLFDNQTMVDWGTSFQTDNLWIFLGGLAMIVAMTLILISGIKTTFRWQNTFWIIATARDVRGLHCLPGRQHRRLHGELQRAQRRSSAAARRTPSSPRPERPASPPSSATSMRRCPPCSRSWSS